MDLIKKSVFVALAFFSGTIWGVGISKINAILPEIQRNTESLSSLFSNLFYGFSTSLFEISSELTALD